MNFGLVVCLAVLIGFLELVRYGLHAVLDAYGFSTFMLVAVGFTCSILQPRSLGIGSKRGAKPGRRPNGQYSKSKEAAPAASNRDELCGGGL